MNVGLLPKLAEEQAMLLAASCRFMDDVAPLEAVRRRCDDEGPITPAEDAGYRKAAADLGWFGLLADERVGGGAASGNGVADAVMVAAERGARLQAGPFPGHSVVVDLLTAAGGQDAVLTDLVQGACWATWALDTSGACRLQRDGDGWRLDGTVNVVAEGARCAWLLLTIPGAEDQRQVLVDLAAPGVETQQLTGLDLTRAWSRVSFSDVAVALIVSPGPARRPAGLAALLSAAETVGAMHADLALAVQYAKIRIAFGRPIGSFQAVKHLLADASLHLEMSKGIVTAAATSLGSGGADGVELAHAAKAFVAERGVELAHFCFQVFGGIGYTWEHDQHLFLRRITAEASCFGSAAWQRERVLDEAGVTR
jgi:alkylation response protein AidB-like acyl-CoA dehydrogenase